MALLGTNADCKEELYESFAVQGGHACVRRRACP